MKVKRVGWGRWSFGNGTRHSWVQKILIIARSKEKRGGRVAKEVRWVSRCSNSRG